MSFVFFYWWKFPALFFRIANNLKTTNATVENISAEFLIFSLIKADDPVLLLGGVKGANA